MREGGHRGHSFGHQSRRRSDYIVIPYAILYCFVFKNYIMGHLPASMRGLDDVEESNFFMVAPLAAAVAAPPPIVPVSWFDIILIYLYLDYEVVVVEFL